MACVHSGGNMACNHAHRACEHAPNRNRSGGTVEQREHSGSHADQPVIHPQHLNQARRHYENGGMKMRAHLCVCCCARLHCVPGQCENYLGAWGSTQSESAVQMGCARGVCSCAGRACGVGQMGRNSHAAGVGGKCEAVCMGGVVQGRLQYLNGRRGPGRRGWHLRAANLRAETCARMSDMSGMSICMDGMQQTACHGHACVQNGVKSGIE